MNRQTRLPHELTDPMHYLDPAWVLVPMLVLAGLAIAALIWWRYRRAAAAEASGSPIASRSGRATRQRAGLVSQIEALKQRFLDRRRYREGCHALAELLRVHVGRRRRIALESRTAQEIRDRLGDVGISSLFELLAELQFRRVEPSRDDIAGNCDLVLDTERGKR